MKEAFIIADIAGEFDALLRLVKNAPKGCPILAVGDIVDRGPDSKEVIEWLMKNGDSLMGNHEHMMLDYLLKRGQYQRGIWMMNGGGNTMRSYRTGPEEPIIPQEQIDWLASRRTYKWLGDRGALVTHAPLHARFDDPALVNTDIDPDHPDFEISTLWNRAEPRPRKFLQIFGHNAHWGFRQFFCPGDYNPYAICLDSSWSRTLTGMHWPSGNVFHEPYTQPKCSSTSSSPESSSPPSSDAP